MPIRNRPQRLQKIQFRKLKNLENLEISFENKHITGIFGTNGSGKSTILHALACLYQPVANSTRRNFKFPNFFIPTTLDLWNGSQFTIEYEMINGAAMVPERKEYKKNRDRWSPRYQTRPHREVFYIGIDSCVPDMEIESRTSRIPLIREAYDDAVLGEKIKGEFYQFNLSSCIRQQNSLTAQFVSFSLSNLANIFYPPPIFTIINLCLL